MLEPSRFAQLARNKMIKYDLCLLEQIQKKNSLKKCFFFNFLYTVRLGQKQKQCVSIYAARETISGVYIQTVIVQCVKHIAALVCVSRNTTPYRQGRIKVCS